MDKLCLSVLNIMTSTCETMKSGPYQKIQCGKSYARVSSLGNTESIGGAIWK